MARALAIVIAVMVVVWTSRYAWTVYELNRGVGDTVFYDAGRPALVPARRTAPRRAASTRSPPTSRTRSSRWRTTASTCHPGIDPIALDRAVVYNLRRSQGTQGGSTITQQLARTLFLSNTRTYGRKVKEAALAVMLEVFLSKREILQLYMNRVFLSGGIYGIETMSQKLSAEAGVEADAGRGGAHRGHHSPADVVLAVDAPRRRAAAQLRRAAAHARGRQDHGGRRSRRRAASASGSSRSRRSRARSTASPRSTSVSSSANIYGGDNPPDWKVHTTFVPELQDAAEASVREGLRRLGAKGLQAALVAMDPHTGNLLAMVGGSDFATTHLQPRGAQPPAARLGVQAVRLRRGARARTVAGVDDYRHCARWRSQAPEGVWIPRDERASEPGRDDAARGAARVEQRRRGAAAAAGGRGARAAAGERPRRAESARRAVAGARQRAGVATRPHRRVRGVPDARLPRAAARRSSRW